MRTLKRNQKSFWYCLLDDGFEDETSPAEESGETEQTEQTGETIMATATDDDGDDYGESVAYEEAVQMYANISPATGQTQIEQFGNIENIDKIIVTDDMSCPIDENTVLFVDKEPETVDGVPVYDYIVKRVSKSLNSISIAIRKVEVS